MAQSPVRLHAERYEALIQRRGRPVLWQQAFLCSCWSMDSGSPNARCKACSGKGYIYGAPTPHTALVTSVTMHDEFNDMAGVFMAGDAVMTVPKRMCKVNPITGQLNLHEFDEVSMYWVGQYDLITLMDDEWRTSEHLVKGEPIYGRVADTLLNDRLTSVVRVYRTDAVTGEVTTYAPQADYTYTEQGKINWTPSGNQPSEGEQYSVMYAYRPVFTVLTNLPKNRHQDGQDLPRYVVLRLRTAGLVGS